MRVSRALPLAALLLWTAPCALAAPLEPQACATLKSEHDGLVSGGAQSDMDRGPDWAKANLAPDRMQKIERLIALKEQLSFRCGVQLTARPAIKEPPKPPEKAAAAGAQPADDVLSALGLSPIPAPKKKQASPAKAKKKKASGQAP